jgi:hypothetical protein
MTLLSLEALNPMRRKQPAGLIESEIEKRIRVLRNEGGRTLERLALQTG